jgi:hypothetical protein
MEYSCVVCNEKILNHEVFTLVCINIDVLIYEEGKKEKDFEQSTKDRVTVPVCKLCGENITMLKIIGSITSSKTQKPEN